MITASTSPAARVLSRGSRIVITATALLGLLATPDVCRATFILSPLPADTPILQLPELATTRGFQVLDPRIGTSILIEVDNLVRANFTTDRLERTTGTSD